MAQSIPEMYGSLVFNDKVMRSKLPKDMYKALKKTIENGTMFLVLFFHITHQKIMW